mmetsp:Transcript_89542/g.252314  ORF Transcript_89542/g.252314 Transcript_89542/m.252314 type:complete len:211 (-) Transcript_89542:1025-1657(-)
MGSPPRPLNYGDCGEGRGAIMTDSFRDTRNTATCFSRGARSIVTRLFSHARSTVTCFSRGAQSIVTRLFSDARNSVPRVPSLPFGHRRHRLHARARFPHEVLRPFAGLFHFITDRILIHVELSQLLPGDLRQRRGILNLAQLFFRELGRNAQRFHLWVCHHDEAHQRAVGRRAWERLRPPIRWRCKLCQRFQHGGGGRPDFFFVPGLVAQ